MAAPEGIRRVADCVWELPPTLRVGMRVPVRIFATEDLLKTMDDVVFTQAANVAATFFSTAHGSGRTMSRTKAKKSFHGRELQRHMEERGIYVRAVSFGGLAEEAGAAYKDIDAVVEATERAGLSRRIVRFTPIGNVKG